MASGTIDVYVKIPTGRNAQYYVRLSDTIETVCQKVAKEENVKETQVRLKYQGKILDRNHSMSYLGVRPETILKAEILVPRPVTLLVALPNDLGETEVTSTSLETVTDVVSQIADVIKEDKSRLVLKYDGRQVRGTTLMDAGLVDGSAVQIEIVEPKSSATKTSEGTGASPEASTLKEEDKQAILSSFDTGGRRVEVVFSFDTTGSMYSCLDQVRTKLSESCTRLIQDIPNIRIGIMAHGDYGDQSTSYVIRSLDLTSDVQSLVDFVTKVPRTGGDDTAECYEWVLRKAQGLDWSEDSAKALVVIGDAYPHPPGFTTAHVFWKDELSLLTGMEIKVYGVRALHISQSEAFYKELSDVSGGHYLTMTNFDVITDMFLAVCYREANQDNLGQFEREVEEAGRMTEERRQIFKSLQNQKQQENSSSAGASREQTVPVAEGRPRRQVTADWWEPTRYQGKPQFKYDPQTDKFSHYREIATGLPTESRPTVARCKSKKKCSVM